MDIIKFETRSKQWVEISHGQVTSTMADDVCVGDHIFRIFAGNTVIQISLSPEQWGKLVDCLSATVMRRTN